MSSVCKVHKIGGGQYQALGSQHVFILLYIMSKWNLVLLAGAMKSNENTKSGSWT